MSQCKINIVIDGYFFCGKSIFVKVLVKEFNYFFIDFGVMYCGIMWYVMMYDIIFGGIVDIEGLK